MVASSIALAEKNNKSQLSETWLTTLVEGNRCTHKVSAISLGEEVQETRESVTGPGKRMGREQKTTGATTLILIHPYSPSSSRSSGHLSMTQASSLFRTITLGQRQKDERYTERAGGFRIQLMEKILDKSAIWNEWQYIRWAALCCAYLSTPSFFPACLSVCLSVRPSPIFQWPFLLIFVLFCFISFMCNPDARRKYPRTIGRNVVVPGNWSRGKREIEKENAGFAMVSVLAKKTLRQQQRALRKVWPQAQWGLPPSKLL